MQTTADEGSPRRFLATDDAPVSRGPVWRQAFEAQRATLTFLVAWGFLDAIANARYPAGEPKFWYLIPSVDLVAVFALYVFLGRRGLRVPRVGHAALVALFLAVRLLRFGDGIKTRYFNRPFNLYFDLPLVPELGRLMHVTLSPLALVAWAIGGVLLFALLAFGIHRALRAAETSLARAAPVRAFACVLAGFLLLSPFFRPESKYEKRFVGAFAASGVRRLFEETKFLLEVSGYRTKEVEGIQRVQASLAAMPNDLGKLKHADVFVFLIESYGETVLKRRDFATKIGPIYDDFARTLGDRGFEIATRILDSPTYGGSSWLAHATIATGVRVDEQLEYDLLETSRPRTMAEFFRRAGYRTVRVEPGTTRESSHGALGGFERRYRAWEFDYQGPRFGWATMPDQYTLDFIRRKELASRTRPLFIEYVLVSSHAPWLEQPELVSNWSEIGNGAIYKRLKPIRYGVTWSNLEDGAHAYLRSISYDLEVLKQYLRDFVDDGSLILVLGDHQPAAEVAEDREAHGVPIHVLSRNPEFVAAFLRRGYTPGMRPDPNAPRAGLDTLLTTLLSEFSLAEAKRN